MPRVRKFEDDLVMKAYPEGQLIFEGQGVRLLSSRENKDISLIESAIEGKDFAGYVEDTGEPLKYTSKLKAGESYMIIDELYDSNFLTHLDILLFNDIMSDEHISRRIPFPFPMIKSLSSRIIPMDENHLLFAIRETVNNRRVIQSYILNVITYDYRCLGEYYSISVRTPNYILLRNCQDDSIWHYNFSVDDMDESHEPDIEHIHEIINCFYCLNCNCICSVRFRDQEIDELIIFDSQRNRVNLTKRFPQLKGLFLNRNSNFALLTLTQDVLSMVFIGSSFTVIHIENGELTMSEGEMKLNNVLCNDLKHIDLNDNYFHDEGCVLFGANRRRRYGPIKFSEVGNEVVHLKSLNPTGIFFDGIAEVYDDFYISFKERKLVILKGISRTNYEIQSVQPDEGDDFFVVAWKHSEEGEFYIKIHWRGPESMPITTTILPHCGTKHFGFIQGLPVNVDYREDNTCLVYLGSKVILELPPNISVRSAHGSHIDNSACILCSNAIHFFRFNINGYVVDIQKHIICERNEYIRYVFFNPRPLAATADHQLFVVYTGSINAETQHLHCLDWSTERYLEPVLLFQYYKHEQIEEGNFFRDFVGDSYMHVKDGIIEAYVKAGAIKTRFFRNDNLPYSPDMKISHDPNLPNNTVQDMSYEEETKTMILKTYNVDKDPESMNPTVETFHLPSFMAEASIFEYQLP
ncbi:hypothetical protein PCE1_000102 [Barthelona sp. PCE]